MNRTKVMVKLGMGLFVAVGTAATLTAPGKADAHATCKSSKCCSPHGFSGSQSGSQFSNCYGSYISQADAFYYRDVTCAAGTPCAEKAGCGSGASGDAYVGITCGSNSKSCHDLSFTLWCN